MTFALGFIAGALCAFGAVLALIIFAVGRAADVGADDRADTQVWGDVPHLPDAHSHNTGYEL